MINGVKSSGRSALRCSAIFPIFSLSFCLENVYLSACEFAIPTSIALLPFSEQVCKTESPLPVEPRFLREKKSSLRREKREEDTYVYIYIYTYIMDEGVGRERWTGRANNMESTRAGWIDGRVRKGEEGGESGNRPIDVAVEH